MSADRLTFSIRRLLFYKRMCFTPLVVVLLVANVAVQLSLQTYTSGIGRVYTCAYIL